MMRKLIAKAAMAAMLLVSTLFATSCHKDNVPETVSVWSGQIELQAKDNNTGITVTKTGQMVLVFNRDMSLCELSITVEGLQSGNLITYPVSWNKTMTEFTLSKSYSKDIIDYTGKIEEDSMILTQSSGESVVLKKKKTR